MFCGAASGDNINFQLGVEISSDPQLACEHSSRQFRLCGQDTHSEDSFCGNQLLGNINIGSSVNQSLLQASNLLLLLLYIF